MISYDTNILVYALESQSSFRGQSGKVVLLGETDGCSLSVLVLQEYLSGALKHSDDAVSIFDSFCGDLVRTRFVDVSPEIARLAASLTAKYSAVRRYDAVHIASAMTSGADIFYTNDQKLVSAGITEIEIRSI